MSTLWLPYIPRYIVEDVLQHPDAPLIGRALRFEAVTLFADISGFTPMSEALGQAGRRGAEELTAVVNSFFEPLIACIGIYGGMVGTFGGDALTALFPCHGTASRPQVAGRAVQCAFDMQAAVRRYEAVETSAGTFRLRMKIGLALGPVQCNAVGDAGLHVVFASTGAAINRCAEAEHYAASGEVVVSNDLLDCVVGIVRVEDHGAFSAVVGRAGGAPLAAPAPLPPLPPLPPRAAEHMAAAVHPALAQRLRAGQTAFVNEHRKVTALWVGFDDLDYDNDQDAGAALQQYVCAALGIIHRYGGYLNRVDMGDKGSKLLALFGAPIIHENDEARAVHCALELQTLRAAFGGIAASTRIGISTGFMFCGHVGAPSRQEYTVMGQAVIVAVRLLQAAQPGQILLSDATRRALNGTFELETHAPRHFKGLREPLEYYAAQAISRAPQQPAAARALPLVGREQELAQARAALEQAQQRRGQLLFVQAEAGLGKTRLGEAIAGDAATRGFALLGGACQSYGTRTSYLLWHAVWRGFFGLDAAQPPAQQHAQLEQTLAALVPGLAERAPLLGPLLNLALPDNDVTRSLDGQMRQDALHALLLACLRARTDNGQWTMDDGKRTGEPRTENQEPRTKNREPRTKNQEPRIKNREFPSSPVPQFPSSLHPLILLLEDCHWIDPLSQELLEFLGRNITDLPVLLLVLHRPLEGERHPLATLARLPHATTLELTALSDAEAEQLVGMKLQQLFGLALPARAEPAPLSMVADPLTDLAAQISDKAQGNPFYIEELVNFIHERGVDPQNARAVQALALPDSLHSLILSRIDRLPEGEQATLKVASVVGRSFRAAWLWGAYPALGTPDAVMQQLDTLRRLDLTPLDRPGPEPEYLFKHAITQEVTYESLSFAMRASLHEQVGQFIEVRYADELPSFVTVLAYHYERTQNAAKQRAYFRLAADAAKATYANQTALYYYEQLLVLLPEREQADVLLLLGEVLHLIGKWPEAEAAYRQALALAEQHAAPLAAARAEDALGYLLSYTESYDEGLRWLTAARATFEAHGDQRGLSKALEHLSFLHSQRSEYAEALHCAEQQRNIAEALSDSVSLSNAEANMGLAYQWLGEYAPSLQHFERSLEFARSVQYHRGLVHASGDMAGVYWMQGDYYRAMELLQEALQAAMSIGYVSAAGTIVGNIGLMYELMGDVHQSLQCYAQGLYTAIELSNTVSVIVNLGNIASTYAQQNQYAAAQSILDKVISIEIATQNLKYLAVDFSRKASLCYSQNNYLQSKKYAQEGIIIAEKVRDKETLINMRILSEKLLFITGELSESRFIHNLNELQKIWQGDEAQASIHYEIGKLDPQRKDSIQKAASLYHKLYNQTSDSTYRQRHHELTYEWLPAPPPLPPVPEIIRQDIVDLDKLMKKVDLLIEQISVTS